MSLTSTERGNRIRSRARVSSGLRSKDMPDIFTRKKRSEVMSRIRSRGNKETEITLMRLLRRHKISGWRRHAVIRRNVPTPLSGSLPARPSRGESDRRRRHVVIRGPNRSAVGKARPHPFPLPQERVKRFPPGLHGGASSGGQIGESDGRRRHAVIRGPDKSAVGKARPHPPPSPRLRRTSCPLPQLLPEWQRGKRFPRGLHGDARQALSTFSVRPDFVFRAARLALFVDGCFWHACPKHSNLPVNNRAFWRKKLNANQKRDKLVNHALRRARWRVLRIWEHDLHLKTQTRLIIRVLRVLRG
jgi:DNA mismatch endonuclease Vsr